VRRAFAVAVGILVVVGLAGSTGNVPHLINYQGRLSESGGNPLTGAYSITFTLFDDETGGSPLWTETQLSVSVSNGLFSVLLGSVTALSASIFEDNAQVHLGVSINGGSEMSPRQRIVSVAYALVAGAATDCWSFGGNAGASDNRIGTLGSQALSIITDGEERISIAQHGEVECYGSFLAQGIGSSVLAEGYSYSVAFIGNKEPDDDGLWLTSWGTGGDGDFIACRDMPDYPNSLNTSMKFRVDSNGNVRADGTFESPAADFAELLPAEDGLEPGDVLVVGQDGILARSSEPYQKAVVGVHSTRPAFLGGGGDDVDQTGKVPLAISGIVPVKATAVNGSITPGDLLTTSDLSGHAMLADRAVIGTVLGKALEPLDEGTGVIRVLVMLQ